MDSIILIVSILGSLALGAVIAWFLINQRNKKAANDLISEAKHKAEMIKKDKQLEAKEHFLRLKEEHEKEINAKTQNAQQIENRLKQKEQSLNQKLESQNKKEKELSS